MPKKMGINTKAAEAKARKDTAKKAKEAELEKKKEDELWQEDDKLVLRKLNRKQEEEKKRAEVAARKAQNRAAALEEEAQLAEAKKSAAASKPTKVTRSQIQSQLEAKATQSAKVKATGPTHLDVEIQENVNRMEVEGDEARNIDEAISILSINEPEVDRHPERRLKAAYAAFEETHLPRLKNENPNLRLSQLKQMLKKDWMKSPENPLNQRNLAYNAKTK